MISFNFMPSRGMDLHVNHVKKKPAAERDAAAIAADYRGDELANENFSEESVIKDIEKDTPTNHMVNITEKVQVVVETKKLIMRKQRRKSTLLKDNNS